MKLLSVSVILSLFLFNCSSDSNVESGTTRIRQSSDYITYEEPYETDLISFEMSFGTELSNTKDEFLLVDLMQPIINAEGDIIVFDECRIKVYDKYGKGKKIFGREGQGPGEFRSWSYFWISPTGYLTVLDRGSKSNYYNLFSPDYNFIEMKSIYYNTRFGECLKTEGFEIKNFSMIWKIYAINETEKVYEARLFEMSTDPDKATKQFILLVYEDAEKCIKLILAKRAGYYFWELLPDRSIVYLNTDEDMHDEKTGLYYYTVNILSLDTLEKKQIIHEFTPELVPESWHDPDHWAKPGISKLRQIELAKYWKDKKYYNSFIFAVIDGNFLFIYPAGNYYREMERLANSEGPVSIYAPGGPVDVFDLEEEKFIGSFYFPTIFETIKDRCAYINVYSEEGFYEIRKYKINPIVYGLPEDPDWKNKK